MSPLSQQAPLLFDAYTPFSYRTNLIAGTNNDGKSWLAPTWVGEHRRRLQAYAVLQGYRDNASRMFMEITGGGEERAAAEAARDRRREYGDASLLIETARASLLGDQQSIVVEDADKFDDSSDAKNAPGVVAAASRQDELRDLAKKDRFTTKLIETERNTTSFGDGVYTLHWDDKKRRPVLLPWDPGCYFPVLAEVQQGDYPTKVHLAWELTPAEAEAKYGERVMVVHRITYEMLEVEPYRVPWEKEPQTLRCYMSEAEYKTLDGVRTPDDLSDENAIWMLDSDGEEIRDKDLGIDFLPVVHIPNTVAELEHFGQSVLAKVLQIVDDIQSVDSDAQFSSDLTGNPILVVQGATLAAKLGVNPGAVISVAKDGNAFFLAASEYIAALRSQANDLRDLLGVNSRITSAAQGRIDPTKIQAGIILQLQFGPLKTFVEEMRLTRDDKYGLIFKFQQRYMILNGVWTGDVLPATLAFGSFLPTDRSGTITDAVAAVQAKMLSVQTAMKMLQEVGVPIDDIGEEVENINKRDIEGAVALLDATGNDQAVQDYLGVKVDRPDPVAVPVQPVDGAVTDSPPNNPPTTQNQ